MKSTFIATIILAFAFHFSVNGFGAGQLDDAEILDEFEEWDGEQLSRIHCVTCHLYPEPNLLPKETWPYLLDLMGLYFGYDDGRMLSSMPDKEMRADLFDVEKYPDKPTLTPFQWAAIRDFYEFSDGSGAVEAPPVGAPLTLFETSLVYGDERVPVTSLVKVLSDGGGFYFGDAKNDRLVKYDSNGRMTGSDTLPGAVVQLDIEDKIERATVIGRMPPSNSATGSILERVDGESEWRLVVDDLHRPVHSLTFDFDGDGRKEILVNEFGHYVGSLSLFEHKDSELGMHRILRPEPGSISARALLLDDESDLSHALVLNAQARQDITLYRNRGGLRFEPEILLQHHPAFGYTQLHLVDLTGDGHKEVVTINGDNADLPGPPLKAYHGIRIYRVLPGPELEEIGFLRMPGAFQATFGDFDGSGFTDIAVVSFFPDPRCPEQKFVYFENRGNLAFERRSLKVGALAPWMTIDSGDLDGDGDLDIVLGSGYVTGPPSSGNSKRLPAGMILRNKTILEAASEPSADP